MTIQEYNELLYVLIIIGIICGGFAFGETVVDFLYRKSAWFRAKLDGFLEKYPEEYEDEYNEYKESEGLYDN